jgi:uncharacterized protein YciI
VRLRRGGPWDWARELHGQAGFDGHARFMDDLVDSGFILLGGPLQGEREVLIIVSAPDEDTIRQRFADDPWIRSGMLTLTTVERWTILLDGLRGRIPNPAEDLPGAGAAATIGKRSRELGEPGTHDAVLRPRAARPLARRHH